MQPVETMYWRPQGLAQAILLIHWRPTRRTIELLTHRDNTNRRTIELLTHHRSNTRLRAMTPLPHHRSNTNRRTIELLTHHRSNTRLRAMAPPIRHSRRATAKARPDPPGNQNNRSGQMLNGSKLLRHFLASMFSPGTYSYSGTLGETDLPDS